MLFAFMVLLKYAVMYVVCTLCTCRRVYVVVLAPCGDHRRCCLRLGELYHRHTPRSYRCRCRATLSAHFVPPTTFFTPFNPNTFSYYVYLTSQKAADAGPVTVKEKKMDGTEEEKTMTTREYVYAGLTG